MADPESTRQPSSEVRRLVEARLAEVESMATIGMLLEGAIHGINNPLASLLAGLEQLCDRLRHLMPTDEQVDAIRIAEEAREEGDRVAAAVRELTGLLPTDKAGEVDLNDVLLSVLLTLEKQLGGRVQISRGLGELKPIVGREARIAQVLLSASSLCIDAQHAQRPTEPVILSVASVNLESQVVVRFALQDSQVAAPGLLSAGQRRRVELLRSVVQQLGGILHVSQALVEVILPTSSFFYDSEADVSLKRRESAPPRGELRILVVDDEPSIQRALERGLREVGYTQTVRSGKGAIELLAGGATFDVILSDVVMAEGTGIDLADWLSRHRPRLKRRLILMTGMGESHMDSHPDVMTVPKPFDLVALRELVCLVSART